MEKCIFLDRFLQHPKDFKKIASFLRNKSTKDCIAFYYDSKQSVPYKGALKEHIMRKKRRGEYQNWDCTIEAALSCGATVSAGPSEEKPLVFGLPSEDTTFGTYHLHPIRHEILDRIEVSIEDYDEDAYEEFLANKTRKRKREPMLLLEKRAQKYLSNTAHDLSSRTQTSDSKPFSKPDSGVRSPAGRRAPQKWTAAEKTVFHDIVRDHGKNWSKLEEAFASKTIGQIKNYYYDYRRQMGRQASSVSAIDEPRGSARREETPRKKTEKPSSPVEVENKISTMNQQQAQDSQSSENQIHQKKNEADLRQQTLIELAALKAAQEQSGVQQPQDQRTPEQEALLLLHQQQREQQQAAQEEARLLLQSQLGLSGLPGVTSWASQLAALQQQQQQQQQHHHHQQQNDLLDLQNVMALRQTGLHGFSLDPAVVRAIALGGYVPLLHQRESAPQHAEVTDRGLAGLAASPDALNALRAIAGLSQAHNPSSIAGILALLGRARNQAGDAGYPQERKQDHARRDRY
jgi:hypothetical protein